MSLLDVLDSTYGKQDLSFGGTQKAKPIQNRYFDTTPQTSGPSASRERGAPERLDINGIAGGVGQDWFGQGAKAGLDAFALAGEAPGFTYERPIAALSTIGQAAGFIKPGQRFGEGTIFDTILSGANDVIGMPGKFVAGYTNSGTAQLLRDHYGQPDNTMVDVLGHQVPLGTIRHDASKRGFTGQDVEDLRSGKKSTMDFADRRVMQSDVGDLAFRLTADPLNLLLGAGAILKVGKGIGLLSKAVDLGAELKQPLAVADAVAAVGRGEGLGATWRGLAGFAGQISARVPGLETALGVGAKAGSAYVKTAYTLTAAQLGVKALEHVLPNGFLEPLYDLNNAVLDNRPLSRNSAFSLWSAFHMPYAEGVRNMRDAWRQYRAPMEKARTHVELVNALVPGEGTIAEKEAKLSRDLTGGMGSLDDLEYHVRSAIAFDELSPAQLESFSHHDSLDGAVLSNAKLTNLLQTKVAYGIQYKTVTARMVVDKLKEMNSGRRIDVHGKNLVPQGTFDWHGPDAVNNWNAYSQAAAPMGEVFTQRGAVIGLVNDVMAHEDLDHLGAIFQMYAKDGSVPFQQVQSALSTYPALIGKDVKDGYWLQVLADKQDVPLPQLMGKIKTAKKTAPTVRELTHESAAAESGALDFTPENQGPVRADGSINFEHVDEGTAQVEVSKHARPASATTIVDARMLRADAKTRAFEENTPLVLRDAGLTVNTVTQGVSGRNGMLEPSLAVTMRSARLGDMRMTAAFLGKQAGRDEVSFVISGQKLAEAYPLAANGAEIVYQLPTIDQGLLDRVAKVMHEKFPDGFHLNDTTGTVRISLPGEFDAAKKLADEVGTILEGFFPRDAVGATGLRASVKKAYIETLKKGKGDRGYDTVLREYKSDVRLRDLRAGADRLKPPARTGGGTPAAVQGDGGGLVAGGGVNDLRGKSVHDRLGALSPQDAAAQIAGSSGYLYRSIEDLAPHPITPASADGLAKPTVHWAKTPEHIDLAGVGVVRVRKDAIGRVKWEYPGGEGDAISSRTVQPDSLEILAGDGTWHPYDTFFDPEGGTVPADLQVPLETASPAYDTPELKLGELEASSLEEYLLISSQGKRVIRDLEPAFDRAVPTTAPMTLYRSINPDEVSLIEGSGGTYSSPRLISASKTPDEIVTTQGQASTVVRVEVPAGSRVLDVDQLRPQLMQVMHGEDHGEVILRPGSKFTVRKDAEGTVLTLAEEPASTRPDNLTIARRAAQDQVFADASQSTAEETQLLSDMAGMRPQDLMAPEVKALSDAKAARLDAVRQARVDTTAGRVLYMAKRDAAAADELAIPKFSQKVPEELHADLASFETRLREQFPQYRTEIPPKVAWLYQPGQGANIGRLRVREDLAAWLYHDNPITSKGLRFVDWLTNPVANSKLSNAARAALTNELVSKGATPDEITGFVQALTKAADLHDYGFLRMKPVGGPSSLGMSAINKIATGESGLQFKGFSPEVLAAVGKDKFGLLMDRSGNRLIRTTTELAEQGGKPGELARAINAAYGTVREGRLRYAGETARFVSRTLYPIFRFFIDPRYWIMNALEADILGGTKYGLNATALRGARKEAVSEATAVHEFGVGHKMSDLAKNNKENVARMQGDIAGDTTGWLYNRHLAGYINGAFNARRLSSTADVIRGMAQDDPVLVGLRKIADADGVGPKITDLAEALDKQLYSFDRVGVQKTVQTEARKLVDDKLMTEPGFAGFMDQLYQRNEQIFQDVKSTFRGNANRSNLERIGNSYWLYWPLSYQIKAAKWLYSIMTDRMAGAKTNLLGAAVYNRYMDFHKEHLATDPEYKKMFADNPTLWFAAQMMLPITPNDIGVSLSRPVRYIGGELNAPLRQLSGGALGTWARYKQAQDPISFLNGIAQLGPIYTSDLLERVRRESFVPAKAAAPPKTRSGLLPTKSSRASGPLGATYP